MPLEEQIVEQEPVFEQLNTEDNTNSDGAGTGLPNSNNPPPNNEPPPMTNDLGEVVNINTTTIRVGTDYFRPKSKVEVSDLVSEKRINEKQEALFIVQYEATNGKLPEEKVVDSSLEENEEEDSTSVIDLNTVLPELSEKETEKDTNQGPIDLQSIAGTDQPTAPPVIERGGIDQGMPVPTTQTATVNTESPAPINLDQIRDERNNEPSSENVKVPKEPLPTPESDPDFKMVSDKIEVQGDKEQAHKSSRHEVKAAEDASEEPQNKKQSVAQVGQVAKIEEQDTPSFDTGAFVTALMDRVKAIMPKTEKEADEFKDKGKVNEVKEAVTGTVTAEQDKSVGPMEQATKEQPDESGIESKAVKPLPKPPIGRTPKDVRADQGMPKPVGQDRIEAPLKENSKEVETKFESNQITEEQLTKSNEPTFLTALDAKKTAQTDSKNASVQLRTEEQTTLSETQTTAQNQGKEKMGGMHQDRANILTNVKGEQENTSQNYSAEEKKVADRIGEIYQSTKTDVEGILTRLDSDVQQMFDQGAVAAQLRFETYVARRMASYKAERYDGVSGAFTWVGDAFTGLPDEVNAFFVEGRNLYVDSMQRIIESIAVYVAEQLTAAKERVQAGRQEVNDYVTSLPDNLRKVGKKAAQDINKEFDALSSQVDAKQNELIDTLAQKYKEGIEKVDGRIEALKTENRGLIDIALDSVAGVIETILEIKTALTNILTAAMDAVTAILLDPIGFLSNLIEGVSTGIGNFMTKIDEYLTTGFVEWLTGAMSGIGIQMPEDIFSLEGIFSLTTQALGMTWDFIRARAVNILGEGPVKTIEDGFEVFQVLRTEGIAGAWEYLKEQFSDIKDTIIGSITQMLISEVVQSGIQMLLSMLTPAGAFVKAAMMIVDVAEFFIRQGSQVMELVKAFTESISALAAGSVGKVAELIERALGLSVPLLIGFFTSLLNLGGLVEKIQKIFKKITSKITGAIDGFIEKAAVWFKDKKGRRKAKKDKKKKDQADKANAKKKKGEEEEDDKRTEKQKAAALDAGMKKGAQVVNNEELTKQQIKVELNRLELKYRLDDLGAKLMQETAEWHLFMLDARLDGKKRRDEIKRKPTKAENEDEVSAADRKLHERIAGEVKAQLEAKGRSTEGVETFEEFYSLLQSEAVLLQKKYQPQLRNGIKIAVDLVNTVKQDEKDGDVDIRVKIAPNTIDLPFYVDWNVNSATILTKVEEAQVRALTGGNDILLLLQDIQAKKQDAIYISTIKEIRVMLALPKTAIFVGGHIAKSGNSIFFEKVYNPAVSIPKFGEIDIFADNTLIEVKSNNWAMKDKMNQDSLDQFDRYKDLKKGIVSIYLNSNKLQIDKTILQIETSHIHVKLLNKLIERDFFDEVRFGNGVIIKRGSLSFKKKKNVKKWAVNRGNNFLISSEADFNNIP